jgi:hypothetical protein
MTSMVGAVRKLHDVRTVRWASHLTVWAVVLFPTILEMVRGWRPLGDDATITMQSFRVLSLHPPLLGQFSTISGGAGRAIFDPGPLQYVVLAIPTHIDTSQGSLWGGALVSGVVLSVAIEAVWRTGYWIGCAAIAFGVVDLAWLAPGVFENLMWNPYLGLPFVIATICLAWVVSLGRFGWWPVLVFTASAATQTEVLFATLTVALAVLSPLVAIARSGWPSRLRWLVAGLVVGILCWVPTIVQQFTGSFGNVSAFVDAEGSEKAAGLSSGLRTVTLAGWLKPIWLRHFSFPWTFYELDHQSTVIGWLVLLALVVVIALAWRTGRTGLASLASIGLTCALSLVVTFGSIPQKHQANLAYLLYMVWIVGLLLWLVFAWTVAEIVRALVRRSSELDHTWKAYSTTAVGLVLAGAILVTAIIAGWRIPSQSTVDSTRTAQANQATRSIGKVVPAGPIKLTFVEDAHFNQHFTYIQAANDVFLVGSGIAWQLTAQHRTFNLPSLFTTETGLTYPDLPTAPTVKVTMNRHRILRVELERPVR